MSAAPRIRIVRNGPMLVDRLELMRLVAAAPDPAGGPIQRLASFHPPRRDAYALCRCGGSSILPFCDADPPYGCFEEEPPGGPAPKPLRWDVPDPSTAAIALKPDGPVRVAGGVPILTEEGELPPADRVSLCRCGASRSQPLCDGSHKVVGFRESFTPPAS